MNWATRINKLVTHHLASTCAESDPEFRAIIGKITRIGMLTTGFLGVIGTLAYVLARVFVVNTRVTWTYESQLPDNTFVLWDKLLVFVACLACITLSRTRYGVRYGRQIVAGVVILISISSLTDDILSGKEFTSDFLILYLTLAAGLMPYKAWQTFFFGLTLLIAVALATELIPSLLNVDAMRMPKSVYVFIGLMTLSLTGLSATLYTTRCDQYLTRRKVERLNRELETAHESLQDSYVSLQQTQEDLVHSQKMASLGRFTAGLSHELKNPLNFVHNFATLNRDITEDLIAEFAARENELPPETSTQIEELLSDLSENAGHIEDHSRRADEIILQMQEYSRKTAPDVQKTDINTLLDQYVNLALIGSEATDEVVEIIRRYDQDLSKVSVSPNEIGHALLNVLNNAIHAVVQQAKASSGTYRPTIEVVTGECKDGIEIRIVDNGPGIPPDAEETIFEPFFTTSSSGVGLGLSVAYDIVTRRYGGQLFYERSEKPGSIFVLRLPYA